MTASTAPARTSKAATTASEQYNTNLRAPIITSIGDAPQVPLHKVEWTKLLHGDPVQINPSEGSGFKVMTVIEWAARFSCNQDFAECGGCGSTTTKEHHFMQTWCRGRKKWESESVCLECHAFTLRKYEDPDFCTPEEHMKQLWKELVRGEAQ